MLNSPQVELNKFIFQKMLKYVPDYLVNRVSSDDNSRPANNSMLSNKFWPSYKPEFLKRLWPVIMLIGLLEAIIGVICLLIIGFYTCDYNKMYNMEDSHFGVKKWDVISAFYDAVILQNKTARAETDLLRSYFARDDLIVAVNKDMLFDDLPRLVCVSDRTESEVANMLDDLESRTEDAELVRLLHAIHEEDIQGHVFRGYTLLESTPKKAVSVARKIEYFSGVRRPVWFVYPGMGSQWPGMAKELMRIPAFAASIEKCHKALESKGINLTKIIMDADPKIYDNILNSFIGIVAVQIGLTDFLKTIGIVPDYIIGLSVGELGCAYADGCFNAEEIILLAYSKGLAFIETPFIKGSMAAVGLSHNEIKMICPPEIEIACHTGPNSTTISGPAHIMKNFVNKLIREGSFAKEVPCSNIAYHSRYIAEAGPTLLKYLKQVIKSPKPHSDRWVSTSVTQAQWKDAKAELCFAEYYTNNLLNPVLFEETSRLIHQNAITIEIAPHGMLQAILNRSLKEQVINVPLTQKNHKDNVQVLFAALGKLYISGLNPHLANI